mgnify:CR=1 FL=1
MERGRKKAHYVQALLFADSRRSAGAGIEDALLFRTDVLDQVESVRVEFVDYCDDPLFAFTADYCFDYAYFRDSSLTPYIRRAETVLVKHEGEFVTVLLGIYAEELVTERYLVLYEYAHIITRRVSPGIGDISDNVVRVRKYLGNNYYPYKNLYKPYDGSFVFLSFRHEYYSQGSKCDIADTPEKNNYRQ